MDLAVEDLAKRFTRTGTAAVEGASFAAAPGGITTLLGPSGSGKTTILRIIAGLEEADRGRVLADGRDITATPVRERGFGFVFQSFALFRHLTVRDNVGFGLEVRRVPRARREARVDELLELVQLRGLGDRHPHQLSGGQRQRVGFARALAPDPRVLLLDEPFGALDTRVRVELRHWLRELHARMPVTTILVTHDQDEALELSDRVVVMDQGRIQQVGSARDIYERPSTPFVASFVGTANVLDGRVHDGLLRAGGFRFGAPGATPDGASARAVVRPHDVRLVRATDAAAAGASTILHVAFLGSTVKLALTLPTAQRLAVELPRKEFEDLDLRAGDRVVAETSEARVFVGDYVI